jgi:hypothetical protein
MRKRIPLFGAALCVVLLGACSTGGQSYSSVRSVATALESNDLACDNLTPLADARLVSDNATCSAGQNEIQILTFKNQEMLAKWLPLGGHLGNLIVGQNWVVRAPSSEMASRIHDALGGDVRP